ncbi:DNA-directed DNA polymerase [Tanacetum coccineum]
MIAEKEEEAINKVKGEALKEKDDPGAFIFPFRFEGKINKNALADTGSDINTMPYWIYKKLGREEIKKVDRGITMINHTQAEPMGILTNVLCQVGVTTIIAKFLILDIPIDRDAPIVVESNSDDEEEYEIKRNKFGAPIYGPKPEAYLNCNDPAERSSALQAVINPFWKISVWKKATMGGNDDEAGSSRSKRSRQNETVEEVLLPQVHHEFLLWEGCNKEAKSRMGCDGEIDEMLRIKLREAGSNEEIFTSVAWIRAFNINEPIYSELCHELELYHAKELDEEGFDVYFQRGLHSDEHFNAKETTGYDKIQKNDLWLLSMFDARHQNWKARVLSDEPGVPRVTIPRPSRSSMQDLYDRMGSMEIRQEAIERMEYRQSYWGLQCSTAGSL